MKEEVRILEDGVRYTPRNRKSVLQQQAYDCQHLGSFIRTDLAGCCGMVNLYQCAVFGECTKAACGHCLKRDVIPYPTVSKYRPTGKLSVTIGIPVRGQIDLLEWVIRLHRTQAGINPKFILVDTGSSQEELDILREWENTAEDIKLFSLGVCDDWQCPAEPVCDALQVIWDNCTTAYLLQTHADCIPASKYAVLDMMMRLNPTTSVVGYRMSPRAMHPDWDWRYMLSHTFTMYNKASIGQLSHNLKECAEAVGGTTLDNYNKGGWYWWPDTECGYTYSLRQKNIPTEIIGPEKNHTLDKTPHYWHCRSLASSALYDSTYHQKALDWKIECIEQAKQWEKDWSDTKTDS